MTDSPKQRGPYDVDLSAVRKACAEYIEDLAADDWNVDRTSDSDAQIAEAVLKALYGDSVFDWIRERMDR